MLRRLIVMRHAKSSWDHFDLSDHERPLNSRGLRDAPIIGQRLTKDGWVPQQVISSDSQRTRETWAGVASALTDPPQPTFTRRFYLATLDEIAPDIGRVPDELQTLLVLGHNEGWEQAVALLCGSWHPITTANAALLSIEADTWEEAISKRGAWTLHEILRPREPR